MVKKQRCIEITIENITTQREKIEKMKKTCISMRYYVGFSSYKCGVSLF
jgi:hypothetical protein